jgi:hypothetical protein
LKSYIERRSGKTRLKMRVDAYTRRHWIVDEVSYMYVKEVKERWKRRMFYIVVSLTLTPTLSK